MNKESLVTICIPNYNNEKTIKKTLDSLLKQTYENVKIKVFDNASTDNSINILREYENKYINIEVFQNEKNRGGEANFTKCIQHLEGSYGAIFHADDIYLPRMIEKQVEFLEKDSSLVAVCVHGYTIDDNERVIGMRPLPSEYLNKEEYIIGNQLELFQSVLKYSNFITCPSVMARTDVYTKNIQVWNGEDFKTSADLDVWLRLANYGKFGIITRPLIQYRESTVSYSYKDTRTRVSENNMFLVLSHYLKRYKNLDKLTNKDVARYDFLLFKDNINRTINQIINDVPKTLDINIFSTRTLKIAIESKENMKIYLIGLVVKILRNIKVSQSIRNKLFDYRFKKSV